MAAGGLDQGRNDTNSSGPTLLLLHTLKPRSAVGIKEVRGVDCEQASRDIDCGSVEGVDLLDHNPAGRRCSKL